MSTPPQLPDRRGWWQRHWRWAVPLLCLVSLLLLLGFVAAISSVVMGSMRSSGAYQDAMARAQAHPDVTASLGEPLEAGWFVEGSISSNGPAGDAELQVPLSGPKGTGDLFVEARKRAGAWEFDTLVVQVDGDGRRIDLRDGPDDTD